MTRRAVDAASPICVLRDAPRLPPGRPQDDVKSWMASPHAVIRRSARKARLEGCKVLIPPLPPASAGKMQVGCPDSSIRIAGSYHIDPDLSIDKSAIYLGSGQG